MIAVAIVAGLLAVALVVALILGRGHLRAVRSGEATGARVRPRPTVSQPEPAEPPTQLAPVALRPLPPGGRRRREDAVTGQIDAAAIRAHLDAHRPMGDLTQQLPRIPRRTA